MGPCRHLLAVREAAESTASQSESMTSWYERLQKIISN
jgi:hypothetical protein